MKNLAQAHTIIQGYQNSISSIWFFKYLRGRRYDHEIFAYSEK